MTEELGKIEKPPVESFKAGRKLYFVPLILSVKDLPLDISLKYSSYWDQVDTQIANLESKLGPVNYILHELIYESGESGLKALEEIDSGGLSLIRARIEKGARLAAAENSDIITELMDWNRCLNLGLQNQKVFSLVYQNYTNATNQRNTFIAKQIDSLVKSGESCVLIMSEGHHVQFPSDMQVIYVSPPALDEIKRWLRDQEKKRQDEAQKNQPPPDKA